MSKSHWTNLQGISALAPNLNPWAWILSEQLPPPSFWLTLSPAADSRAACTQSTWSCFPSSKRCFNTTHPQPENPCPWEESGSQQRRGSVWRVLQGPGRLAGSLCCSRTPTPRLTPLHPSTLPAGCHSPSPSQEGIWQGEPAPEWSATALCVCVCVEEMQEMLTSRRDFMPGEQIIGKPEVQWNKMKGKSRDFKGHQGKHLRHGSSHVL